MLNLQYLIPKGVPQDIRCQVGAPFVIDIMMFNLLITCLFYDNERQKKTENDGIVSTLPTQSLMQDLRQIIDGARGRVAAQVNSELTLMYWHIGDRINREVLGNERAEYGKQIVATVARKLSFSHFQEVMYLKDVIKREFYLTLAASERWSKRQLREKIDGMLFERTAISTKPDELISIFVPVFLQG